MMKKFVLLLLIFAFVFGCKNDGPKQQLPSNDFAAQEKQIMVIINAVVPVTDYFEVYYYETGLESFDSKDFIEAKVTGSELPQDIKFTLPLDMFPERLRLDFGKTSTQKKILLNSIKLIYGNKEYEFSREQIINEMKPSKFINFNIETFEIETQIVDNRYDPYFYSPKLNNVVNYLLED